MAKDQTQWQNRISVSEIAGRMDIGPKAVYEMLEQGILPGIRLKRRWIISRHAYDQWEMTCDRRPAAPESNPRIVN